MMCGLGGVRLRPEGAEVCAEIVERSILRSGRRLGGSDERLGVTVCESFDETLACEVDGLENHLRLIQELLMEKVNLRDRVSAI